MRDPSLRPNTTPVNRLGRAMWSVVWLLLFLPSPRPLHSWRSLLLRCFGARLGKHCHIYPSARIWAPWNLACEDYASIGPGAEIYNPKPVRLAHHAIISQGAYLCGATHDLDDPDFPMISRPIEVGPRAWICARAVVMMGVSVGEGAILGLGAIASRDLEPWSIYAGNPARRIKVRPRHVVPGDDRS